MSIGASGFRACEFPRYARYPKRNLGPAELTTRSINVLRNAGYSANYYSHLICPCFLRGTTAIDIMRMTGSGVKTLANIEAWMASCGMRLATGEPRSVRDPSWKEAWRW